MKENVFNSSIFISFTSMALAAISLLLSLYLALGEKKKSISFRVDVRKHETNECFLTFWNSSSETIYKEDIFCLSIQSDIPLEIKNCYQNDRITISIGKEMYEYGIRRYIYPVSFDMLMHNRGAVFEISSTLHDEKCICKGSPLPIKIGLVGRLKGQESDSVRYYRRLNAWNHKSVFYWYDKVSAFLNPFLTMFVYIMFSLLLIIHIVQSVQNKGMTADTNLAVLIWAGLFAAIAVLYMKQCFTGFPFSFELWELIKQKDKMIKPGKVIEDESCILTYEHDYAEWRKNNKGELNKLHDKAF